MMSSAGTRTVEKANVLTCVVYEPQSGEIVHTHTIMVLPEAYAATQEDLAREALELAKRHKDRRDADLHVLHVAADDANNLRSAVSVDPRTRRLVFKSTDEPSATDGPR